VAAPKAPAVGLPELTTIAAVAPNRRASSGSMTLGVGKWARGVALPPPEDGANRRRPPDADDPNELWDDALDSNKPAADFSSFGTIPDDPKESVDDAFTFDNMTEATLKFEAEMRGGNHDEDEEDEQEEINATPVDASRPLATTGTTIRSGSGDNVNVFEDFDDPVVEPQADSNEIQPENENPDASLRLMQMIGITPSQPTEGSDNTTVDGLNLNPWASASGKVESQDSNVPVDSIAGLSSNPWGGVAASPQVGTGFDLVARLEAVAQEQKAQENMQIRLAREQEMIRRRQVEEETQRRVLAQKQAEEQTRQQQPQGLSQVELILMERISLILENSWGRSDLVSVLTTLHSEDPRVIPLLGNVDALRSLVTRHPRRIALRHDPAFGSEMAVLLMTNAQFQQQQQLQDVEKRVRQDEIQRVEQQRRINVLQKKQSIPTIDPNVPWFYSDPQGNVQGPFRGEEMRQWLEAGYFKGDLPISQKTTGQFIPLANIFPDLSIAFRSASDEANENAAKEAAEALQLAKEEEQRRMADAKSAAVATIERKRREQEVAAFKARQAAESAADAAAAQSSSNGDLNNSSAQLKMMLGLGGQHSNNDKEESYAAHDDSVLQPKIISKKPLNQEMAFNFATAPPAKQVTVAASAWGAGVSKVPARKSMSEIQQEEARTAAFLAMERQATGRSNSSGWANVAATSGPGWQSGALKQQTTPSFGTGSNNLSAARVMQPRGTAVPTAIASAPRRASGASAPQADDFGATMSPSLEAWCKEQMRKFNGSDDLTLVSFCMTLNDPAEIRQYLTAYLGTTPQISYFATEFINRKGGGKGKAEEWETTVKPKKTRKAVKK
jgi:GYF domain